TPDVMSVTQPPRPPTAPDLEANDLSSAEKTQLTQNTSLAAKDPPATRKSQYYSRPNPNQQEPQSPFRPEFAPIPSEKETRSMAQPGFSAGAGPQGNSLITTLHALARDTLGFFAAAFDG
ncbi:hypothetical protein FRB90_002660, partial [Tulasnella sp. 427]